MPYTVSSTNTVSTRHQSLLGAFKAAKLARKHGATEVVIEDIGHVNHHLYTPFRYLWGKNQDGEYTYLRGSLSHYGKQRVAAFCQIHGLPFVDSETATWVGPATHTEQAKEA